MSRFRKSALAVAGAVAIATASSIAAQAQAGPALCRSIDVPGAVAAEQVHIHATSCEPAGGSSTAVLLVPGSTYNESYWDFRFRPETYSFR